MLCLLIYNKNKKRYKLNTKRQIYKEICAWKMREFAIFTEKKQEN